jgi:DnaJ domain
MAQPRPPSDPKGYYARLGVTPTSGPDAIIAAYRREARVVHPDVPRTGDAAAFMALKEAYDVLIHAGRRAAYDHGARGGGIWGADPAPGETDPMPAPDFPPMPTRHPWPWDLHAGVWIGLALLVVVGVAEIGRLLLLPPPPARYDTIPALAQAVPPATLADEMPSILSSAPVRLAGTPNMYVLPTAEPVTLWRRDDSGRGMLPWGQLPPFSAVQGLRLLTRNGLMEVKVTDANDGYIDARSLTPGDADAASGAWCTYHAGDEPANGEILSREGTGSGDVVLTNRSGEPVVVKIRSDFGLVVASIFLAPNGRASVAKLPVGRMRVQYATGEVWSRACHGFTASQRAEMLPGSVLIGRATQVSIPPAAGAAPIDLSDHAFERE